jgi:hypothetical protein
MLQKIILAVTLCAITSTAASAALLTGTVNTSLSSPQDISAAGTLDWAIWNNTNTATGTSFAPTNVKLTSPGLISNITSATADAVRGVGSLTQTFSYTDGTSPNTLTNSTMGGIISNGIGVANTGPKFTVTGNPGTEYIVSIWGSGGNGSAVGILTASLNGAPDVVLSSQAYTARNGTLFTIHFKPDLVTDLLNIKYLVSPATVGNNQFTAIQAVAVSAVPEPSSIALGVGGLAIVFGKRLWRNRRTAG